MGSGDTHKLPTRPIMFVHILTVSHSYVALSCTLIDQTLGKSKNRFMVAPGIQGRHPATA